MPYSENSTIAAIDDVAELQIILDAADRMHAYHLQIRAELSAMEQERRGRR